MGRLLAAATAGDEAKVRALLAGGGDVLAKPEGRNGWTPLHGASYHGHAAVAEALIAGGSYVHAKAKGGGTPLHVASFWGHAAVVAALLAAGADVHAKNEHGVTPLHGASCRGYAAVVAALLAGGSDVHATNKERCTPLHGASDNGHVDVVAALLARGADAHAKDRNEKTPRDIAVRSGRDAVVEMLDSVCGPPAETEVASPIAAGAEEKLASSMAVPVAHDEKNTNAALALRGDAQTDGQYLAAAKADDAFTGGDSNMVSPAAVEGSADAALTLEEDAHINGQYLAVAEADDVFTGGNSNTVSPTAVEGGADAALTLDEDANINGQYLAAAEAGDAFTEGNSNTVSPAAVEGGADAALTLEEDAQIISQCLSVVEANDELFPSGTPSETAFMEGNSSTAGPVVDERDVDAVRTLGEGAQINDKILSAAEADDELSASGTPTGTTVSGEGSDPVVPTTVGRDADAALTMEENAQTNGQPLSAAKAQDKMLTSGTPAITAITGGESDAAGVERDAPTFEEDAQTNGHCLSAAEAPRHAPSPAGRALPQEEESAAAAPRGSRSSSVWHPPPPQRSSAADGGRTTSHNTPLGEDDYVLAVSDVHRRLVQQALHQALQCGGGAGMAKWGSALLESSGATITGSDSEAGGSTAVEREVNTGPTLEEGVQTNGQCMSAAEADDKLATSGAPTRPTIMVGGSDAAGPIGVEMDANNAPAPEEDAQTNGQSVSVAEADDELPSSGKITRIANPGVNSDAAVTVADAERDSDAAPTQGKDAKTDGQYLSAADSSGEVEKWLSKLLPRLQEGDAVKYRKCLSDDGFDSSEIMNFVREEDLHFMKTGHRRALVAALTSPSSTREPRMPL